MRYGFHRNSLISVSYGPNLFNVNGTQDKRSYMKENIAKGSSALQKSNNVSRDIFSGQRTTIAKICEEGKNFTANLYLFFHLMFEIAKNIFLNLYHTIMPTNHVNKLRFVFLSN